MCLGVANHDEFSTLELKLKYEIFVEIVRVSPVTLDQEHAFKKRMAFEVSSFRMRVEEAHFSKEVMLLKT